MTSFIASFRAVDWITLISLLVSIEMAIGHGTVQLTDALPESWIPRVKAWCNIFAFFGSTIIAVLSRAAAVILLAVVAAALLAPAPAMAQQARARPPLTGNIGADIKNATSGVTAPAAATDDGLSKLADLLGRPFRDLAAFINSDAASAVSLSTVIPELQDGHGQQCWMAMGTFTAVLKAHPIPLTLHAMTDLEAFRLAAMAANNLCQNAHCTQVFGDLSNSIQKVAPVNLGIGIPSLQSLCANVPQVTVVPPVQAPAPAAPANP